MPARSGRLEKRIHLTVPVEISTLQEPSATERTSTENVCSLGARVVTERQTINGRKALVQYLTGDLKPTDPDTAELAMVVSDDGEHLYLKLAEDDDKIL